MYPSEEIQFLKDVGESKIRHVFVNESKTKFFLQTEDPTEIFQFNCMGDCCSRTWIEHVTFEGEVFGQSVARAGNIKNGELFQAVGADFDTDQLLDYADVFETPRGKLTIEYRNASNGYYGGSLDYAGKISSAVGEKIIQITEDF